MSQVLNREKFEKVNLLDFLPKSFWSQFLEFYEIQRTLSNSFNLAYEDILDVQKQLFVESATWGLSLWELSVGITPQTQLSDEARRSIVLAKLRGQGTTTADLIKSVSESFSNGEVEIIENFDDYSFTVKFVGSRGIPLRIQDLKNAIDEIKPAHLNTLWIYVYNTWKEIGLIAWNDIGKFTWKEIYDKKLR